MHWECVCVRACARLRQTRETNVVFRLTADIPSCQAQRSHRSRIKGSNLRQSRPISRHWPWTSYATRDFCRMPAGYSLSDLSCHSRPICSSLCKNVKTGQNLRFCRGGAGASRKVWLGQTQSDNYLESRWKLDRRLCSPRLSLTLSSPWPPTRSFDRLQTWVTPKPPTPPQTPAAPRQRSRWHPVNTHQQVLLDGSQLRSASHPPVEFRYHMYQTED